MEEVNDLIDQANSQGLVIWNKLVHPKDIPPPRGFTKNPNFGTYQQTYFEDKALFEIEYQIEHQIFRFLSQEGEFTMNLIKKNGL